MNFTFRALILLVFISIFAFSINAQPPFDNTQTMFEGLSIEYPPFQYYKNENITFFYHVYADNGVPTTQPLCRFHLYNQDEHIYQDNNVSITPNGLEYYVVVNASYFEMGQIYSVIFDCYNATHGGFVSKGIKITEDGTDAREHQTGGSSLLIILAIIFIGLIFTTFVFDNSAFKVGTSVLAVGLVPFIINIVEKIVNISYPYSIGRIMVEQSLNKLNSITLWIFGFYFVFAIVYMVIYFFNKFLGKKSIPTPYDNEMGDLKKW